MISRWLVLCMNSLHVQMRLGMDFYCPTPHMGHWDAVTLLKHPVGCVNALACSSSCEPSRLGVVCSTRCAAIERMPP